MLSHILLGWKISYVALCCCFSSETQCGFLSGSVTMRVVFPHQTRAKWRTAPVCSFHRRFKGVWYSIPWWHMERTLNVHQTSFSCHQADAFWYAAMSHMVVSNPRESSQVVNSSSRKHSCYCCCCGILALSRQVWDLFKISPSKSAARLPSPVVRSTRQSLHLFSV